jgi:hypothetical protein
MIAYNLSVVVHEIFNSGIEVEFRKLSTDD